MSVSTLSFSATLPPFNTTSGFNNNFSNTNLSATGNLSVATGANSVSPSSPTVSGSVTANGINFSEKSASLNGNTLTVSYQSSEVNSGVTSPSTVNINGGGVDFSPSSATTHGNNVTTTYNTSPNSNFNVPIHGNAVSTGTSSDEANVTLKSLSLVGNTLTATYEFTGNLPNNSVQAPTTAVPQEVGTVSVGEPSAVNANAGATFSSRGITTIGDLLAASNGISFNGTLTGALQQPPSIGQATGVPDPNATLAAILNPNIDASPNSSLQVTDFIDTSLNAFPTSAPANQPDNSNNTDNSFSNGGNNQNDATTQNTRSTSNSGSNSGSSSNASQSTGQVGIYNAISNANASTIRGTGVNTVA